MLTKFNRYTLSKLPSLPYKRFFNISRNFFSTKLNEEEISEPQINKIDELNNELNELNELNVNEQNELNELNELNQLNQLNQLNEINELNSIDLKEYEIDLDKSDLTKDKYFFTRKNSEDVTTSIPYGDIDDIDNLNNQKGIKQFIGPYYPPKSNNYISRYQNILKQKGTVTNSDFENILNTKYMTKLNNTINNKNNIVFEKLENALEQLKFEDENAIGQIKLRLILNLNLDRYDHKINGSIKLPNQYEASPHITLIGKIEDESVKVESRNLRDSESSSSGSESESGSSSSGSESESETEEAIEAKDITDVNTDSELPSNKTLADLELDNKRVNEYLNELPETIPFNKIVYIKPQPAIVEKIESVLKQFDIDSNEYAYSCDDLSQAKNIITSLRNNEEYFKAYYITENDGPRENIVEVTVGNTNMNDSEVIENINFFLNHFKSLKPESIKEKFILCGYLKLKENKLRINTSRL